jgi:hypothetical protein
MSRDYNLGLPRRMRIYQIYPITSITVVLSNWEELFDGLQTNNQPEKTLKVVVDNLAS